MAFHRLIVEASGNELLLSLWEAVVLESRFRKTLSKIGEEQLVDFGQAHLPVLKELAAGDGKSAGKLLKGLICKYHGLKLRRLIPVSSPLCLLSFALPISGVAS